MFRGSTTFANLIMPMLPTPKLHTGSSVSCQSVRTLHLQQDDECVAHTISLSPRVPPKPSSYALQSIKIWRCQWQRYFCGYIVKTAARSGILWMKNVRSMHIVDNTFRYSNFIYGFCDMFAPQNLLWVLHVTMHM